MKLSRFTKLAVISTAATYLLIFMGGLVRVSGAGLGCPDWPKCFGRWIPPTNLSQIPEGIDPATFNLTLAWIEYINRLLGVTIGFLILATAIVAIVRFRKYPRILYTSCAAAVLTAVQGWQGSVVVASELKPIIVSVHTVLALVIVSLLIYASLQSYYVGLPHPTGTHLAPSKLRYWTGGLWALSIIQIALGTQIRESLEILAERFPVMADTDLLAKAGMIPHIHMTLGLVLAGGITVLALWVGSRRNQYSSLVVGSTSTLVVLSFIQIFTGLAFMVWGTPPIVQIFHLWIASLMIGFLLLAFSAARAEAAPGTQRLERISVSPEGR